MSDRKDNHIDDDKTYQPGKSRSVFTEYLDDTVETLTEGVRRNIEDTLNQLRAEIDSAFSVNISPDNPASKAESIYSIVSETEEELFGDDLPEGEERLKQALKLTEYLLKIKEKEIADATPERDRMRASVIMLASALASAYEGTMSIERMVDNFTDVTNSTGAVLWVQIGGRYSVATGEITVDEGKNIFDGIISNAENEDIHDSAFTIGDKHYLMYTRSGNNKERPMLWVLIFARNDRRVPYSTEDVKLGGLLSRVVFSAAALVDL